MPLSRRQFLQSLGITWAASTAGFSLSPGLGWDSTPFMDMPLTHGRALHTTLVHQFPDAQSPVVKRLWEDEVFEIRDLSDGWFHDSSGYVTLHDAQPMILSQARTTQLPFWGEVSGASATIRAWGSADAPFMTRIGHGGVMRIIDHLLLSDGDWYGVADDSTRLLGWSRAEAWSPIDSADSHQTFDLIVERATQSAILRNDRRDLLHAAVALGEACRPGVYPITDRMPGTAAHSEGQYRYGIPWVLKSGNFLTVSGVYWHNRFGAYTYGRDIQIPVRLARTIYPYLARVIVV